MTILNTPGTIQVPADCPAVPDLPTAIRLLASGFYFTR